MLKRNIANLILALLILQAYGGALKDKEISFRNRAIYEDVTFQIIVIIVCCFCALFFSSNFQEKKNILKRMFSMALYIPLAAIMWTSYYMNPSHLGLEKTQYFTFMILPMCAIFLGALTQHENIRIMAISCAIYGLFIALVAFAFRVQDPFYFLAHKFTSPDHITANYLFVGSLCGGAAIVTFFLFLEQKKNSWRKALYLATCIICLLAIIYAGERASPAIFVMLIIFYTLHNIRKHGFITKKNILTTVLMVIILTICFHYINSDIGERFRNRFQSFNQDDRINIGSKNFDKGIENIRKSPLFGVGPSNYYEGTVYNLNSDNPFGGYPHNIIFEIAGELGIVGLLAFLLVLANAIRGVKIAKNILSRETHIMIFYLGLFFFLRALKTGDMISHRIFWMIIAFYLCINKLEFYETNKKNNHDNIHNFKT